MAFIVLHAVGRLSAVLATNSAPLLGLDLQGGASVVLAPANAVKASNDTLNQAIVIIRTL